MSVRGFNEDAETSDEKQNDALQVAGLSLKDLAYVRELLVNDGEDVMDISDDALLSIIGDLGIADDLLGRHTNVSSPEPLFGSTNTAEHNKDYAGTYYEPAEKESNRFNDISSTAEMLNPKSSSNFITNYGVDHEGGSEGSLDFFSQEGLLQYDSTTTGTGFQSVSKAVVSTDNARVGINDFHELVRSESATSTSKSINDDNRRTMIMTQSQIQGSVSASLLFANEESFEVSIDESTILPEEDDDNDIDHADNDHDHHGNENKQNDAVEQIPDSAINDDIPGNYQGVAQPLLHETSAYPQQILQHQDEEREISQHRVDERSGHFIQRTGVSNYPPSLETSYYSPQQHASHLHQQKPIYTPQTGGGLYVDAGRLRYSGTKLGGGARRIATEKNEIDAAHLMEEIPSHAQGNQDGNDAGDVHTPIPHPHLLGRTSNFGTPELPMPHYTPSGDKPMQKKSTHMSPSVKRVVTVTRVQGRALRYPANDDGELLLREHIDKHYDASAEETDGTSKRMGNRLYYASPPAKNRSFLVAPSTVLTEEKRKKRTYIVKRNGRSGFKKTDPVSRYHATKKVWKRDPFLRNRAKRNNKPTSVVALDSSITDSPAPKRVVGSNRKHRGSSAFGYSFASPLRNYSSSPQKQRPIKVNDYVVPTSKKRDALRWSVRARMMDVS